MKLWVLALLFCAGCAKNPAAVDLSPPAYESGDWTVIFQGCHQKPSLGYSFCKVWEESLTTEIVEVIFPDVACKRENCIEILILGLDGNPVLHKGLPAGENVFRFTMLELVGKEMYEKAMDGEYRFLAKIWHMDSEGREFMGQMKGVLRLLVLSSAYQALTCNDPDRGWVTPVANGCYAEHSTQMRAALCGVCE